MSTEAEQIQRRNRWCKYWPLVLGVGVALLFAVLYAQSEFRRGKVDAEAAAWCLIALQADTENERLGKALNNRQAMESFMQNQTDAYLAVLDAFNKVAPDMPMGNVPADPELQGLCVLYYKKTGTAWDGNAEKLRRWGQEQKEISDTTIPDTPEPIAGGPE